MNIYHVRRTDSSVGLFEMTEAVLTANSMTNAIGLLNSNGIECILEKPINETKVEVRYVTEEGQFGGTIIYKGLFLITRLGTTDIPTESILCKSPRVESVKMSI